VNAAILVAIAVVVAAIVVDIIRDATRKLPPELPPGDNTYSSVMRRCSIKSCGALYTHPNPRVKRCAIHAGTACRCGYAKQKWQPDCGRIGDSGDSRDSCDYAVANRNKMSKSKVVTNFRKAAK